MTHRPIYYRDISSGIISRAKILEIKAWAEQNLNEDEYIASAMDGLAKIVNSNEYLFYRHFLFECYTENSAMLYKLRWL